MTSIGEDMEKLGLSYTDGGKIKGNDNFGKQSGNSQAINHSVILRPNDSTLRYISKKY